MTINECYDVMYDVLPEEIADRIMRHIEELEREVKQMEWELEAIDAGSRHRPRRKFDDEY